jgi:hypothetical protein
MLDAALSFEEPAGAPSPARAGRTEGSPGEGDAARRLPRLVVYDFESGFDGGRLGAKVADVITGHAARSGRFETFAEIEQEGILAESPFRAALDSAVGPVGRHAREAFDADIALWGRVDGSRETPLLHAKAFDLRDSRARLALDESYACENVHHIPLAAERILAALLGEEHEGPTRARTVLALSGNLLDNGSFGKGLAGWEPNFPRHVRVEDGQLVFELPKGIAAGHGLAVMSGFLPVEEGAHYELSLRVRSRGPSVITWVKAITVQVLEGR